MEKGNGRTVSGGSNVEALGTTNLSFMDGTLLILKNS